MGSLKRCLVAILLAYLAILMVIPAHVTAWKHYKSEWNIGNGYIRANDELILQKPETTLFHYQDAVSTSNDALAISFPAASAAGAGGFRASAIGGPTIAQTSDDTLAATSTGLFNANFCYCTSTNPGGGPVYSDDILQAHPIRSNLPAGSGYIFPYMTRAGPEFLNEDMLAAPITSLSYYVPPVKLSSDVGGPDIGGSMTNATDAAGGIANGTVSPEQPGITLPANATNRTAPESNQTALNNTANNRTSPQARNTSANATREDIMNTTTLERMWRNAFLKTTMDKAFTGEVSKPQVIAPVERPMDIIKPFNRTAVYRDSIQMARPGSHLSTAFWDL